MLPECRSPNSDLNMLLLGLTAVHHALAFQVQHAAVGLESSQIFLSWEPLVWCSRFGPILIFLPGAACNCRFLPTSPPLPIDGCRTWLARCRKDAGSQQQAVILRHCAFRGDHCSVANRPDWGCPRFAPDVIFFALSSHDDLKFSRQEAAADVCGCTCRCPSSGSCWWVVWRRRPGRCPPLPPGCAPGSRCRH